MSYILDALRKADAQRQRDPARGIHAQRAGLGNDDPAAGRFRPWIWAACVAGIAALAGTAWYVYLDRAPVQVVRVAPGAAPAARVAVATPVPAPPPAAVVLPPPPIEPARPAPAADPAITSMPAMRAGPPPAIPSGPSMEPRPGPPPQLPSPAAPPPAIAAPAIPPAAAATVKGLPADAPKVAISGGVYSANPAQRMLIVNGQVFAEGAELAPGLVLLEIRAKSAVLSFHGSRYAVSY